MTNVILVDEKDAATGIKEKMEAHYDGDLHRAFSVMLYNSRGEILVHRRAFSKYHCGGLWTNACCSHPYPGEKILDAAKRRLYEELGYRQIDLTEKFVFQYKAVFENGIIENEIDHIFSGVIDSDPPLIDSKEIENCKWISIDELEKDIQNEPLKYTVWFRKIMNKLHP